MRTREVVIEYRKTIADSGTETIDIDLTDPVTQLDLWFFLKNGAAVAPNVPPASIISKIELVDGSDVLWSLNGHEAIALYCFDRGKEPFRWLQEKAGMSQYENFPICPGRYKGDQEYAFDFTRFTNPQLKITWAKNALHAAGSLQYSLFATVMEGVPKPKGWLMTKPVETFTSAASGDKRIDLPVDYPYRKLLVRAYEPGTDMNDTITKLKLSVDMDKFIPFELYSDDFIFLMWQWFKPVHLFKRDFVTNGAVRDTWMGVYCFGHICPDEGAEIVRVTGTHGCQYTVNSLDNAGAGLDNVSVIYHAWGVTPENTFCYPFGDQMKPEEWFKAPDYKSIRLFLTQGNADADVSVILQQERPYA